MKMVMFFAVSAFTSLAWAETVDIKDVSTTPSDEASTTTIEIKKAKPGTVGTTNQWEVTDGNADVEGEAGATQKDAKANWKKSCADWKKEIREENKDNKVISLNCASMACSGEAGSKICTSKATYKIKTKVN